MEGQAAKRYITNSIFVALNLCMTVLSCIFLADLHKIVKVLAVLIFLVLCIGIPSINQHIIYKLMLAASALLAVLVGLYIILDLTGAIYIFKDFDIIRDFILSTGPWGIVVYSVIVVLQSIILPIPAAVIILIGVAIYGPLWAFVIVTIGTVIGSFVNFMLGRTFGKKLVTWLFGAEKVEKYTGFINKKGRGMFVLMLLFPFFPDDLICMLAGLSGMKTRFFMLAVTFTRPLMIGVIAFFGSGEIIPFKGWGIPVWIGLFLLAVVSFIIITVVKNKISKKKNANISK